MGSQRVGVDGYRLHGRKTVGKVRKGGRKTTNITKERIHKFRVREEHVACHGSALAVAMTDDARWEAEM